MEDQTELQRVRRFTRRSEVEKALNTLEGILLGVSIDSNINGTELQALESWCGSHFDLISVKPFDELVSAVRQSLVDGVVTSDELANIRWFAASVRNGSTYWNVVTSDMQVLQGILHGILADGVIEANELRGLQKWLFDNEQLLGSYPYDELAALTAQVLKDGRVDPDEEALLKVFFSEFVDVRLIRAIDQEELARLKSEIRIEGICALAPELEFLGSTFCFTGISPKAKRSEIAELIEAKGGTFNPNVVKSTKYLIYGDKTNPVWACSCYGRKVEQALELRKAGHQIAIVHEVDFWDALLA